jgi:hypothetical protein
MRKILLLLVVVGVVSLGVGYYMFNMPPKNLSKINPDVTVSANELMSAFEDNEQAANEVYLGRIVEVSGKISNFTMNDDGSAQLILETPSLMGGISCNFNIEDISGYKTVLRDGEDAVIKGKCSGYLMDVVLERCVVINLMD